MNLSWQSHLELIYFVNRTGEKENSRSWWRPDRFRSRCLPNNLSGVESDQPRQRTRLTVPGCTVEEIRGLTGGGYSTSCLTDGGRLLCRQTVRDSGGKSACLRVFFFLYFFACLIVTSKEAPEASWPSSPERADLSLTSSEGRGWTRGEWPFVTSVAWNQEASRMLRWWFRGATQVVARGQTSWREVCCGGSLGWFGCCVRAWWMVEHNEQTLSGLTFKD